MKVIFVTGNNGNDNVVDYLSSILKEEGYKTGIYRTVDTVKRNSRFLIDNRVMTEAKFKKYEKIILDFIDGGSELTLFEALVGIAYRYFADENCDFAIMETEVGGRYDPINVAEECLSIITSNDKAGIIKKGIVITETDGKTLEVIVEEAKKKGIPVKSIDNEFFAKFAGTKGKKTGFDFIGESFYTKLETGSGGKNQVNKAALAVVAAEELGVENEAIRKGLKKAKKS